MKWDRISNTKRINLPPPSSGILTVTYCGKCLHIWLTWDEIRWGDGRGWGTAPEYLHFTSPRFLPVLLCFIQSVCWLGRYSLTSSFRTCVQWNTTYLAYSFSHIITRCLWDGCAYTRWRVYRQVSCTCSIFTFRVPPWHTHTHTK